MNLPSRIFRRSSAQQEDAPGPAEQTPSGAEQGPSGAEHTPAGAEHGATVAKASAQEPEPASAHACPHCDAPMADEQEWCTQCGERSGGSLRKRASWASAGVLTAASAILASGAAAAGVAALTQGSAKEPPRSNLVAQTPVTTTTATPAAPPPAVSPGSPETLRATSTHAPTLATSTSTSHSRAASVPATQGGTTSGASQEAATTESHPTTTTSSSAAPEIPELQGLTASAYTLNTEYQKASLEGPENDPMRALEGPESGTSWTVQIKAGTAANVNVGLLIALGGPTRVGSVEMHTSTPGFPVEIYGTTSEKPPATITAWKRLALTPALKASATLKLGSTGTHWRYVLLWIPKVSASTSRVALGEVALYPPTG